MRSRLVRTARSYAARALASEFKGPLAASYRVREPYVAVCHDPSLPGPHLRRPVIHRRRPRRLMWVTANHAH